MSRRIGTTFGPGVVLLPKLRDQNADVPMTSVPEVLYGQSDPPTGEEVTETVTAGDRTSTVRSV